MELLEPLAFLLARLLNGLPRAWPRARSPPMNCACGCSSKTARRTSARCGCPCRRSTPRRFLKLLQLDLEAHPPPAPMVQVWMGANPVKPQAAQSGLFIPAAPEPVKLELTLARIKAIVGENRAGVAGALDHASPGCLSHDGSGTVAQIPTPHGASRRSSAAAARDSAADACRAASARRSSGASNSSRAGSPALSPPKISAAK